MQKTISVLLVFLLTMGELEAQTSQKAVFIILDGIPAVDLERVHTPNLDRIAQIGGYARAFTGGKKGGYSETPTISAVGYNSLLTGTWANKHKVWGNGIESPNYYYKTIFRFFKEAFPEKKTAIFSTWEDNRTKLLGEGLPQTSFLKLDYLFDGFELDTLTYPHDSEKAYIRKIDNLVSYQAAHVIKTQAPDLSWVYLEYTDDMGHRYGKGAELDKAIQLADEQVGRIFDALEYRQKSYGEDWLIWITTDHGRDGEMGKSHGGQSDAERMIWMITNAQHLNSRFLGGQAAMVDVLPSIARFMNLGISREVQRELDGVPLIGPISFSDVELVEKENIFQVSWRPVDQSGTVRVYLSLTNHFSGGQRDRYKLIGEANIAEGMFTFPKSQVQTDFFKVLIEGKENTGNVWWLKH